MGIFLSFPHTATPLNCLPWVGAYQMEPPSPLISWVNPFPSRFINRTACFPRKVSYFRESRMSPWRKWSWMKSNSEAHPSTVFPFTIRPFYDFTAAGIWVSWKKVNELPDWDWAWSDGTRQRTEDHWKVIFASVFICRHTFNM